MRHPRAFRRRCDSRSGPDDGFMADGPGFHIWEETHDEALRSASELAESISPAQVREMHRRAEASARRCEGSEEGA